MSERNVAAFIVVTLIALLGFGSTRTPPVSIEAHAQATRAPTEEPTKAPYVFPTPPFIPTYTDITPTPARGIPGTRTAPAQPTGEQTYTVQSGDSPWVIAQKVYGDGTKYKLILEANGLDSTSKLRIGMVLKIPATGDVPPAATPVPTTIPTPMLPTLEPTIAIAPAPTPIAKTDTAPFTTANLVSALDLLAAILFVASLASGLLAYLAYERARRLGAMTSKTQPLRLR